MVKVSAWMCSLCTQGK